MWSALHLADDDLSPFRTGLCLALGSFLCLYFELIAIRWLSTEIRYFAYYKNIPLLACFLGLGIGFARAEKRGNPFVLFLPLFSLLAVALIVGSRTFIPAILAPHTDEAFLGARTRDLGAAFAFYALIAGVYAALTVTFIPLGQATGRWTLRFSSLGAYTINVAGSLAGVLVMTALGFLGAQPLAWYAIGAAACVAVVCLARPRLIVAMALSVALLAAGILAAPPGSWKELTWSPYSKIELRPLAAVSRSGTQPDVLYGHEIRANQDYYQKAIDLSDGFIEKHGKGNPILLESRTAYELPYSLRPPGDVLVLGAGMGNDVAAAIRREARSVEAVEIDPVILRLGELLHPERPYGDARVRTVVDDARAFLRHGGRRYDTIAYGLLDSHGMLSSMSAVRIDNFVYTVEGIRDAARHLGPNGLLSITFAIGEESRWLRPRLALLVQEALRQEPVCFDTGYDRGFSVIAGPGLEAIDLGQAPLAPVACRTEGEGGTDVRAGVVPTDDWPFLYLPRKEIPEIYLKALVPVALVTVALALVALPGRKRVSGHFFTLGAGFLLIETKAITDLALLLGTTWVVNAFAFAAILALALAGNALVHRFPNISRRGAYALLFAAIAFNLLIPGGALLGLGYLTRGVLTALLLVLPLGFSAIVFARSVTEAVSLPAALGSNLLGAMAGGLLEYSSMVTGFRSLWGLAAILYAASALLFPRRR